MDDEILGKLKNADPLTGDYAHDTDCLQRVMEAKRGSRALPYAAVSALSLLLLVGVVVSGHGGDELRPADTIVVAQELRPAADTGQKAGAAPEFIISDSVDGKAGEAVVLRAETGSKEDAMDFAKKIGESGELRDDGAGFYALGRLSLNQGGAFGWMDTEAYSTRTIVCKESTTGVSTTAPEGLPCVPDDDSVEYSLPRQEEADAIAKRVLPGVELIKARINGPYWNLEYHYVHKGAKIMYIAQAEVGTSGLVSASGIYTDFSQVGRYRYVSARDAAENLKAGALIAYADIQPSDQTGDAITVVKAEMALAGLWGVNGQLWAVPTWFYTTSNKSVIGIYAIEESYLASEGVGGTENTSSGR